MRLFRAVRDFFSDLGSGDPVALIIAGVILALATLVTVIWIVDLRRRRREAESKKPATKGSSFKR